MLNLKERLRASGVHLGLSCGVAIAAAAMVFGLWYPYPYREISGGRELFLIVVAVDILIGPLITFAIFDRVKPWQELRRDLAVVGLLQLLALGYGLWTVYVARPVHLVFEIDRFRVIHAIEVPEDLVGKQPAGIDPLPLMGPTLLSVRPFRDSSERMEATLAALQGAPLGARPDLWQPYPAAHAEVLKAAKPFSQLRSRFPAHDVELDALVRRIGRSEASLGFLPLAGRKMFWTVVLDMRTAEVLGYLPLDSF